MVAQLCASSSVDSTRRQQQNPVPFKMVLSAMILGSTIEAGLAQLNLTTTTRRREWKLGRDVQDAHGAQGMVPPRHRRGAERPFGGFHVLRVAPAAPHHTGGPLAGRAGGSLELAPGQHHHCTDYACQRNQIDDMKMYQTLHVEDSP